MSFRIYSSEENHLLQLPLPGVQPENIEVFIERNELVIQAERSIPEGKLLVGEFSSPKIERRFQLDSGIDTNQINASYNQGLLSLSFAKKAKRIDVKVA